MLLRAADKHGIDLRSSFMIGDRWRDVSCGHAAGCRTIFIDYSYDEALRELPDFTVKSLEEAAAVLIPLFSSPPPSTH
jgi:D-glycero-D-manno-heptose 1,7-bisphosphate phosphatase